MRFKSYQEWRDTIPWTAKQIADALRLCVPAHSQNNFMRERYRQWADRIESGGPVTSRALGEALPFLVATCEFCERKALYRLGNVGRCSKHRDVKDDYMERKKKRLNRRDDAISASLDRRDQIMRAYDKHRAAYRASHTPKD